VIGIAIVVPSTRVGEPSFAIGISMVHPHTTDADRETALAALREAAATLTRPVLVA